MNCEFCTKPISNKELASAKEGTAFRFYDHNRQKEVAYHKPCYDEKWGPKVIKPEAEYKPKK